MATQAALPGASAQGPAPKPETAPLARYLPKSDNLMMLVEFDGLNAHADAWKVTATYKVLNDTPAGAMLEDLLTQLVGQSGGAGPAPPVSGVDALAMVKFLAGNGFLFAVWGDPAKPGDDHALFVFRGAARKENRPITAKLLNVLMGPGAKTQKTGKAGRTIVEVVPAAGPKTAWWTEKDSDLIYVGHVEDVEAILATADGTTPNAVDSPQRTALFAAEGPFAPVGGAMMDLERIKQVVPKARQDLEGNPLRKVELRWGFDGPAIMSVLRVHVPGPHQGPWTLIDQPTFDFRALPPIPAGVDGFTVFSLDLDRTYDTVTALARRTNPQAGPRIDAFEKLVQDRTRRKLREDFLAPLGPKMVVYLPPGKTAAARPATAGNPLAALGAGVGFQVPRIVFLAETTDPARFSRALDELILFANKQFESQFAVAASGPQAKGAARKPAGAGGTSGAPKFQMTSSGSSGSPKTYVLKLPTQLAALTNLNLTIAMGQKHLVIASAADAAREALALEGTTEGRWTPEGDLAQSLARLPEGRLMMLRVNDPRDSLPEAMANLPQTITLLSSQIALAAQGKMPAGLGASIPGAAPGGPGGGDNEFAQPKAAGNGTNINRRKLGITGADPPPAQTQVGVAGVEGNDATAAPASTAPMPVPGGPPGAAPGAPGAFSLKLDPAKAPRADQIRPLLFPGSTALAVDDQGLKFVTRSSFPDVVSPSGMGSAGVMTALLLPAVQSAREAARRAVARNDAAIAGLSLRPGEANVGAYVIKVPPTFEPAPLPTMPEAPPGTIVQTRIWKTPDTPQGSLMVVMAIFSGPKPMAELLDPFVAGYLGGVQRSLAAGGLTDFSEDSRSPVEMGGRKFIRLEYSAGAAKDRHVYRGAAYITAEGNDAVTLAGAAREGQEKAMMEQLDAAVASLRRGVPAPAAAPN